MTFCLQILFDGIKLVFRRFGRWDGLAAISTRWARWGELQRTLQVQKTLCKIHRVQVYQLAMSRIRWVMDNTFNLANNPTFRSEGWWPSTTRNSFGVWELCNNWLVALNGNESSICLRVKKQATDMHAGDIRCYYACKSQHIMVK